MSDQYKQSLVWSNIKIGDDVYMISFVKRDNVQIFLTNLIDIWMETLTNEIIFHRCKKLNPLLNVHALNYTEIVENILRNLSKHITEASTEEIKLCAQVEGCTMKFNLNLSKGSSQDFWEIITKPLCISSMEIIRQHRTLVELIKKKDEEIAEYKAEGAELIRKNIETKTFEDDQLKAIIPIPDIIGYTNAFQAMMDFYNALNLCNKEKQEELKSSINIGNQIEKTQQNAVTFTRDDNLVYSKPGTSNSKSVYECKNATEKVASNKTKLVNMMHKPIKKAKKGLNDFI